MEKQFIIAYFQVGAIPSNEKKKPSDLALFPSQWIIPNKPHLSSTADCNKSVNFLFNAKNQTLNYLSMIYFCYRFSFHQNQLIFIFQYSALSRLWKMGDILNTFIVEKKTVKFIYHQQTNSKYLHLEPFCWSGSVLLLSQYQIKKNSYCYFL